VLIPPKTALTTKILQQLVKWTTNKHEN